MAVADTVDATICGSNFRLEAKPIYFVKSNHCLLTNARDWQLRVDIGERLKVPEQIATTTLRHDLILWSTKTRQVVVIELTVPCEENIGVA